MKKQLNIQLEQKDFDLLEAAVFLRRLKTPQELIRPVVDALLDELSSDPAITRAVAQRQDRPPEKETKKVTALRPRRQRGTRKGDEPSASS
jgi:hypothetical protein